MIKHLLGGSQAALFVCPHRSGLPGAVGAYVGINNPRPSEHRSSPPHILPDGLPGAVLVRVETALKHPVDARLLVQLLP